MFDLCRSYYKDIKERAVVHGERVTEEGQLLVYVTSADGSIAVKPCAGGGGEHPAGFAIVDSLKSVTAPVIRSVSLPANAAEPVYVPVHSNIIGKVTITGDALPSNPTTPVWDGKIMFADTQRGKSATITYRYKMTVAEAIATFQDRAVNSKAQDYFSTVSVGCLEGEVFTTLWDTTAAEPYDVGAPLYCAEGGLVSAKPVGEPVGVVSLSPSVRNNDHGIAYLGCKFFLPVST